MKNYPDEVTELLADALIDFMRAQRNMLLHWADSRSPEEYNDLWAALHKCDIKGREALAKGETGWLIRSLPEPIVRIREETPNVDAEAVSNPMDSTPS